MPSSVPNVDSRTQNELDLQLWVGVPDSPSATNYEDAYYLMLRDAHNITVSYTDGGDHNSLNFSMYKDSQGAKELAGDWEIIVRWWDPRTRELLEPPGSRFVILNTEEDMVDGTNLITYNCVAITWLLEKVRVRTTRYVNYSRGLNRAYDRAKERFEEAERDYDSAFRDFERLGQQIQERLWPDISKGPMLLSYGGVTWMIRDGHARYRSLVYNDWNRRLYWYSYDRQGMALLNMSPSDELEADRRQEMEDAGRTALNARRRMNTARTNYKKADRAARETSRDGTRYFYNRTPGRLLAQLWMEGAERDSGFVGHNYGDGEFDSPFSYRARVLKGVWRGWTTVRDSKGRRWVDVGPRDNYEVRLGQSIWDVIQDFRERGIVDIRSGGGAPGGGGRSLFMVPKGDLTVDQSERVSLRLGVDVTEAPETVDRSQHQTVTFVLDSTGLNRYTYYNRGVEANQTPWGYWEGAIQEQDADSLSSSISLTSEERRNRSRRYWIDASRRSMVLPNRPIPMLDYEPHHLVQVYDHEGAASVREVTQVVVEKPDADSPVMATVRLGTRRTNREIQYGRTLNKIQGGSDHIQGHIPLAPGASDIEIPQGALHAPTISSLDASVRFNEDGRPRVGLSATVSTSDIPEPEDAASFEASDEGQALLFDEEYEGA